MPGPARAGAVIYAKDLARMATFYETLFGMRRLHASPDHVVLESADLQLVIHGIPPHIAATFEISSAPEKREETAIKLFLTVPSLEAAARAAPALGGEVFGMAWEGPGFRVRDTSDPEGNILQLREPCA